MAEVYSVPIAPHGMASPLGQTAFAQVAATVPNFMILESGQYFNANVSRLAGMPRYAAGFLDVPDAPGIGVSLNEDVVKELLMGGTSWRRLSPG